MPRSWDGAAGFGGRPFGRRPHESGIGACRIPRGSRGRKPSGPAKADSMRCHQGAHPCGRVCPSRAVGPRRSGCDLLLGRSPSRTTAARCWLVLRGPWDKGSARTTTIQRLILQGRQGRQGETTAGNAISSLASPPQPRDLTRRRWLAAATIAACHFMQRRSLDG